MPRMRRWFLGITWTVLSIALLLAVAVWLFAIWPQRDKHPRLHLAQGTLAIQHARVYTSPTDPVLPDATILIVDGRIQSVANNVSAVGPTVNVPSYAKILPCNHCVVTAGFWNAHVHFTEPGWTLANWKPAPELNARLADLLTSHGFTTVVDTGSNYLDTIPLRRRIERGELAGPYIYTAEGGLYPPHGIPFYLRDSLPKWMLHVMAQPESPEAAVNVVDRNIANGADITKLFTGSYIERDTVLPMPLEIARAAVERTHQQGRLVFAHPSDLAGTQVAIDSGVDVLAHAPDTTEGVDRALLQTAIDKKMAMVPTLKMFATTVTTKSSYLDPIYAVVHQFHEMGGQLIFGTDVGYMHDHTTDGEFSALQKCGLTTSDVLAMLTVNPASRMGASGEKGTITPGKLADLTILDADPGINSPNQDFSAFAKVRMTIRSGRVLYQH